MAVEWLLPIASDPAILIPFRCHAYSALGRCFAGLRRARAAQSAMEAAGGFGIVSSQLLADDAYRMLTLGGVEEARKQLVQAAQSDASCTDALVMLGKLLLGQERLDEASEVAQFGLEQSPFCLSLHALLARILEAAGQPGDAATYWRHLVMVSPRGESAHGARLGLARCLLATGDRNAAVAALQEGMEHTRHPRQLLQLQDRIGALVGDAQDSVRVSGFPWVPQRRAWESPNPLVGMLKFHGLDAKHAGLAEQLSAKGLRWHDLVAFLRAVPGMAVRAFLSDTGGLRLLLSRGLPVVVGLGGDSRWVVVTGIDDALGVVEVLDPTQSTRSDFCQSEFAELWDESDRLAVVTSRDGAGGKLDGVTATGEELVTRWLDANAAHAEGRGDAAMRQLRSITAGAPEFGLAAMALAQLEIGEGRYPAALTLLDAGLQAGQPWGRRCWAVRARVHALWKSGRSGEALSVARAAVRKWPGDTGLRLLCGAAGLAAGNRTRGRTEVIRGLDLAPLAVWPRIELARDYLATGDLRWARHHLIAAMELEPDNDEAAALLANMPDH
jgi:predicted Zn-dependent protease